MALSMGISQVAMVLCDSADIAPINSFVSKCVYLVLLSTEDRCPPIYHDPRKWNRKDARQTLMPHEGKVHCGHYIVTTKIIINK